MRPRPWDDEIGTGVGSMDTEHRLQVSLVNAVEEVLRHGQDRALADRTLAQLIDFTSVHFHSEELMMRLYSYPQLDAHSASHAKLMEHVRLIEQKHRDDRGPDALEVVGELRTWLVSHIKSMDQQFALWLAKNDIKPS